MDNIPTEPAIIDLPKFLDRRGNLSFIEQGQHIPFDIARTYWVYDVPGGETRGGHAYRQNQELIVALSGSFDVVLTNAAGELLHQLPGARSGIYPV